jgi:hypothetical protein
MTGETNKVLGRGGLLLPQSLERGGVECWKGISSCAWQMAFLGEFPENHIMPPTFVNSDNVLVPFMPFLDTADRGFALFKKPLKNNALLDILLKKLKVSGQCGRILV